MNFSSDFPRYALLALIGLLFLSLLQNWFAFSDDYDQAVRDRIAAQAPAQEPLLPGIEPVADDVLAEAAETPSLPASPTPASEPVEPIQSDISAGRHIVVSTDTQRVTIDRRGGDIVEIALLKHRAELDENSEPMLLLENNQFRRYIAQSGLSGPSGTNARSALSVFQSAQSEYQMVDGEPLSVDLQFADPSGVTLTKRYHFKPDSYLIDIDFIVDNNSGSDWQALYYAQIGRDNTADPGGDSSGFGMRSYLGAAITTDEKPYQKIPFKEFSEEPLRADLTGSWVAMIQHYFVSAWVPPSDASYSYYTRAGRSGLNIIGFHKPFSVAAGEQQRIGAQFYAGPKEQYRLQDIAEHLDLTVDYGWFWWLAQPLYTLLYFFATGELHMFGKVYDLFPGLGNWGFAIIALTIVVKALFFQLSAASYRSMANMRRVQPKMLAIRDRYANDKQAQSKAMMELYQKEKINPLGGCLPILIQMPVFIALYWALMESVELRHAPFIGWIEDLSVMDPYFVLPVIMGFTMWFQQKLNPPPPDPMQAKVMQWMPIIFTFFFIVFPAGLVIYWISNNVLSILQQWVITRQIEKAHEA